MSLVLRSNYGDDSIALIELFRKWTSEGRISEPIYVVYIVTGWAGIDWPERVLKCQRYVERCGFEPISLNPKAFFSDLVLERRSFPSQKYQWCANFLKGLPLLEWLDEKDPSCEWTIAMGKRQSQYRVHIPEFKQECPFHGERKVWHPIYNLSEFERDKLVNRAGFSLLNHRSLECVPCIHSTKEEFLSISHFDRHKMESLSAKVKQKMIFKSSLNSDPKTSMDKFNMGCGDPFGCGV